MARRMRPSSEYLGADGNGLDPRFARDLVRHDLFAKNADHVVLAVVKDDLLVLVLFVDDDEALRLPLVVCFGSPDQRGGGEHAREKSTGEADGEGCHVRISCRGGLVLLPMSGGYAS